MLHIFHIIRRDCSNEISYLPLCQLSGASDRVPAKSLYCQDAEKLQLELNALEADLHRLELCRSHLKDVDLIRSQLYQNLHELLQLLKKEATVNLEIFFAKESTSEPI